MSATHPRPIWRVTLDGQDLTARFAPRLLELSLTSKRGDDADQLDLTLHDHDGAMALPRSGVTLSVALGWDGQGLIDQGSFRVDDVEHSGAPDVISLKARSADLTAALRIHRERSWHATTLGAVLKQLAGEHGLGNRIAPALAAITLPHLDQSESDINLVTRLAKRFDAVATVKAGQLLFLPLGGASTADGQALPAAVITRSSGDGHRWARTDRSQYSGVRAYWHVKEGANRKGVLAGDSGSAKELRHTYPSEAEAIEAAKAEWGRIQRGAATLSLTLALGRPDLQPEAPVTVAGFKPEIDGTFWVITQVAHRFGSGGFTTSLELETKAGT